MNQLEIRPATVNDAETILRFVTELATYEKAAHEVKISVEAIGKSIFSEGATAHALICLVDGQAVGFAVYFYNYSTWLGKNGLYLEDLYVSPENRGSGAGKAILKYLARLALSKGCGRFEWCVLDWNEPAIKFYESIGAQAMNEWLGYRMSGDTLQHFASSDD